MRRFNHTLHSTLRVDPAVTLPPVAAPQAPPSPPPSPAPQALPGSAQLSPLSTLTARDRIIVLPHLPKADFFALLRLADVVLDTFPIGGGITSFDAFAVGAPVVTLPRLQQGER